MLDICFVLTQSSTRGILAYLYYIGKQTLESIEIAELMPGAWPQSLRFVEIKKKSNNKQSPVKIPLLFSLKKHVNLLANHDVLDTDKRRYLRMYSKFPKDRILTQTSYPAASKSTIQIKFPQQAHRARSPGMVGIVLVFHSARNNPETPEFGIHIFPNPSRESAGRGL